MPSTRNQKAKERRSRQSDVMSDMENLGVMLESYSRNEVESQLSENERNIDLRTNERQSNTNPNFRTLLNIKSRGSSEITAETVREYDKQLNYQSSLK